MVRRSSASLATGALAALLGLAGCSDDKELAATSSTTSASGDDTSSELSASVTSANPTTGASTGDTSTGSPPDPTGDPPPDPGPGDQLCQEACRKDADCTIGGSGVSHICAGGRCVDTTIECFDDAECRILYSGWSSACSAPDQCPAQTACIDLGGGAGTCAFVPSDELACADLKFAEVVMPLLAGGDIVVCAETGYSCVAGFCKNPCEDDEACAYPWGTPRCNVDTGECECSSDADCSGALVPGWQVCLAGVCGCAVDEHCKDVVNADTCNSSGQCGCTSTAVCEHRTFDGTVPICAPP